MSDLIEAGARTPDGNNVQSNAVQNGNAVINTQLQTPITADITASARIMAPMQPSMVSPGMAFPPVTHGPVGYTQPIESIRQSGRGCGCGCGGEVTQGITPMAYSTANPTHAVSTLLRTGAISSPGQGITRCCGCNCCCNEAEKKLNKPHPYVAREVVPPPKGAVPSMSPGVFVSQPQSQFIGGKRAVNYTVRPANLAGQSQVTPLYGPMPCQRLVTYIDSYLGLSRVP